MKVTYNDGKMNFLRKQEVKDLKKKIKEVNRNFHVKKKKKRIFKTKRGKSYKRFRRKN